MCTTCYIFILTFQFSILGLLFSKTESSCSIPSSLVGTWFDVNKNKNIIFTATTLTNWDITIVGDIKNKWTCVSSINDVYVFRGDTTVFIPWSNRAYFICMKITVVSSDIMYYYVLNDRDANANNERVYIPQTEPDVSTTPTCDYCVFGGSIPDSEGRELRRIGTTESLDTPLTICLPCEATCYSSGPNASFEISTYPDTTADSTSDIVTGFTHHRSYTESAIGSTVQSKGTTLDISTKSTVSDRQSSGITQIILSKQSTSLDSQSPGTTQVILSTKAATVDSNTTETTEDLSTSKPTVADSKTTETMQDLSTSKPIVANSETSETPQDLSTSKQTVTDSKTSETTLDLSTANTTATDYKTTESSKDLFSSKFIVAHSKTLETTQDLLPSKTTVADSKTTQMTRSPCNLPSYLVGTWFDVNKNKNIIFTATTLTNWDITIVGDIKDKWTCVSNINDVYVFRGDTTVFIPWNNRAYFICMKITFVSNDVMYYYLLNDRDANANNERVYIPQTEPDVSTTPTCDYCVFSGSIPDSEGRELRRIGTSESLEASPIICLPCEAVCYFGVGTTTLAMSSYTSTTDVTMASETVTTETTRPNNLSSAQTTASGWEQTTKTKLNTETKATRTSNKVSNSDLSTTPVSETTSIPKESFNSGISTTPISETKSIPRTSDLTSKPSTLKQTSTIDRDTQTLGELTTRTDGHQTTTLTIAKKDQSIQDLSDTAILIIVSSSIAGFLLGLLILMTGLYIVRNRRVLRTKRRRQHRSYRSRDRNYFSPL